MGTDKTSESAPVDAVVIRCCCKHPDARQCFLSRHPECRRYTDDVFPETDYERTFDDACECYCHRDDDEYGDDEFSYG